MDAETLLREVVIWAENADGIAGVALVGSYAYGAARPDSDVDLVLLMPDPKPFLEATAWLDRFGPVASCDVEDWGAVTSLRVVYESGLEVEFGLSTPAWADIPVDAGTRRVVSDGMRVLYDPEGIMEALQRAVSAAAE